MILDKRIEIHVKSSVTISKLKKINILSKIGDKVIIGTNDLWLGSNILVNVECDICGNIKKLQFNSYIKNIKKYNIYSCSNSCAVFKNKKTKLERYGDENYQNIKKTKKTKLERYGDENYNNMEKTKKTNLERYGVVCSLQSKLTIEKTKKTNLERYGVEDSRKSEKVKINRRNTCINKYNKHSYMNTNDFREKSKITSLYKYGFDSPNKSKIIKDKKVKSMLKKYGYISNSMTDESKNRLKQTNLDRYGVEYPMQVLEFFSKQQKNSRKISKYNNNLYYQGTYEKDFLDHSSSINIINEIERGPCLDYQFYGNNKKYFPDFYIGKFNLIIEIKSSYYYNKYYEKNQEKKKKCIELGYNFLFIINKNYTVFNSIIDKT